MTHREKVRHLVADLGNQGVNSFSVAPPLYRLLWLIGFKVPPPHMQDSGAVAKLTGSSFAVVLTALMILWRKPANGLSVVYVCLMASLAGVYFGRKMAKYYRDSASKLFLPSWENYPRN